MSESDEVLSDAHLPEDARRATAYLVAAKSDEFVAIMSVLEDSPRDLTPVEVMAALRDQGLSLPLDVIERRLDQLVAWLAASGRPDHDKVRRFDDLYHRNYRYTATLPGRQVHRFYKTVLAGTTVMREIPMASLQGVVAALEQLAAPGAEWTDEAWLAERTNAVFTSHDNLDGSLVGAEDTLMALASRYDLDDDDTIELKLLLVSYATRVAVELERGADRAAIALVTLRDRFELLARATVSTSDAAGLIDRNLLAASRGGNTRDWDGLVAWFDPVRGRAARFQQRMVAAIPTFHANLRRHVAGAESGTSRARALALARACLNPEFGQQVYVAALGDHPWRKLYLEADEDDSARVMPWRDGPRVEVDAVLRTHGRVGRGRAAAPRDDSAAREALELERAERERLHRSYLAEILAAEPGQTLTSGAARVALAALLRAVRQLPKGPTRHAVRDGLACTLTYTGQGAGLLAAPTWRVWLPARAVAFHAPGTRARMAVDAAADPDRVVDLHREEVA